MDDFIFQEMRKRIVGIYWHHFLNDDGSVKMHMVKSHVVFSQLSTDLKNLSPSHERTPETLAYRFNKAPKRFHKNEAELERDELKVTAAQLTEKLANLTLENEEKAQEIFDLNSEIVDLNDRLDEKDDIIERLRDEVVELKSRRQTIATCKMKVEKFGLELLDLSKDM